jgi:DNA-binding Lrp family transcriptional regulator
MLTINEKKVLRILLTLFGENYSINQIARECSITPNGALKILRKFEKESILKSKKIANIVSYSIDFSNEKTKNILELSLNEDLTGRVKFRYEDLKKLKEITEICILFGSYINLKKEPNDLDIFFMLNKLHFKEYNEKSLQIYKTIPIKVQDVLQTEEDLKKNIANKDKVIIEILKTGKIFWGGKKIIEIIEDGYKR